MDSTNFLCFAYGRGSSFNALPYTVNIILTNSEKLIDLNKILTFVGAQNCFYSPFGLKPLLAKKSGQV